MIYFLSKSHLKLGIKKNYFANIFIQKYNTTRHYDLKNLFILIAILTNFLKLYNIDNNKQVINLVVIHKDVLFDLFK